MTNRTDYDEDQRERVLYILTEELGADYDEAVDLIDSDFETALWIAREVGE